MDSYKQDIGNLLDFEDHCKTAARKTRKIVLFNFNLQRERVGAFRHIYAVRGQVAETRRRRLGKRGIMEITQERRRNQMRKQILRLYAGMP